MNIFCERQRGGLCRLHALNNYLGCPRYDEAAFGSIVAAFDRRQRARYGSEYVSAAAYDAISSDQNNVVSYTLAQYHNIYTRYVAPGGAPMHFDAARNSGAFFVFSADHIWIVRLVAGPNGDPPRWYKVDSIGETSVFIHFLGGPKYFLFVVMLIVAGLVGGFLKLTGRL